MEPIADYPQPTPYVLPGASAGLRARRFGETALAAARDLGPYFARRAIGRRGTGATSLRHMFERLGVTYIKFGQAVASSPAIIPEDVAEEFRTCLDKGPSIPWSTVRRIVEEDLGGPLERHFATFERRPIASASIAVVHRATLHDGRRMAVKIVRPDVPAVVTADLDLMEPLFRFAASPLGFGEAGNAVAYAVGLRIQVAEELNLLNELQTMQYFRALYARFGLDRLIVPEPCPELSSSRVLTMEFIDGVPVDDFEGAAAMGVNVAPLVRELLRSWTLCALGAGIFHADIHAGNLVVTPDGKLAMLDWGIVSRLDEDSQSLFRGLVEVSVGREEAWDVVTDHMITSQGVMLQDGFGFSREDVKELVKMYMTPVLTSPMKDVSMAALFLNPERARAMNHGEEMQPKTWRQRWQTNRTVARAMRKAMDSGHFEVDMQRQIFLAGKQLLYLERYGRMYTPDEALLGDKEFLVRILDSQPEHFSRD